VVALAIWLPGSSTPNDLQTLAQIPESKMTRNEPKARLLRQANDAFKEAKSEKPINDYAKAQQSIDENRERLKAERLAREVSARETPE